MNISLGIGRRVERRQGAVWVLGAKPKSSFLHGTLRFGVTWDGEGEGSKCNF